MLYIPDITGELPLRTCGSTASMKVKNVKKLSFTKGHFPKMAECAHFHYENVDFGNIQLSLPEEQSEVMRNGCESKELVYLVQISCQGKSWIVKRSYEDFRVLDKHLHLCIYDRRFSQLAELPRSDVLRDSPEVSYHRIQPGFECLQGWGIHNLLGHMIVTNVLIVSVCSIGCVMLALIQLMSKKHGKLITFLRSFMKSRPTKQKLKQRGILKERVFGCDLGEHLLNSGCKPAQCLGSSACITSAEYTTVFSRCLLEDREAQKMVLSANEQCIVPLFPDPAAGFVSKSLSALFQDAVSAATDEERLVRIHDVIQQLPPPHYRTLEYLMRHLARLADYCTITNMHAKNLAIVWAPNLLRSKQIESACFSGTAAFMEVRIQSVVVEFILNHTDVLFSSKFSSVIRDGAGDSLSRPKSLLVSSPSTKLLTLEEAQARTQGQINSPMVTDNRYIEVGEGPAALQGKFHTVIDFPSERKRPPNKMKKSPVGSWRSFFNLGKSSSVSKRKLQRNPSEPSEMKVIALAGGRGDSGTLRSAKSEESLTSLHAVDGESSRFRPRRPRSSSDALSASFNGELLGSMNRCNSYDNLPHDNSDGDKELIHVPALISPRSAEDVDLSPPDIGVASLDFDPMSFQCSPPQTESDCPDSSTSMLESIGISKEKPSLLKKDLESGSQSQTPGSATSSEPVSPFQEKMSPFFTLDLSPTEEKTFQPGDTSPQMGKKPIKSPPLTTSEPVSFALPSCTSESIGGILVTTRNSSTSNWSEEIGITEITNRFPTQMSLPLKETERAAEEEAHQELKHAQIVAAGKPELPEEGERPMSSSQNKTVPSGHAQPGTVHFPPFFL
uniref:Rho GTPase activating protein 32 n=1 Tax=Meleagris gallopavo TaxID=9103 RepID=A0A803YR02_MELGA